MGSAFKREMGRRVWWSLTYLDWSMAPSYNYAYSIHPDQIHTAFPANVDDEDLEDGKPVVNRSMEVASTMTFQIVRIQLGELVRRMTDHVGHILSNCSLALPSLTSSFQLNRHSSPSLEWVLRADGEWRTTLASFPTFLRVRPSVTPSTLGARPHLAWETISLHLVIHNRLLRLHRPYLLRLSPKYKFSRAACVNSARQILRLMHE